MKTGRASTDYGGLSGERITPGGNSPPRGMFVDTGYYPPELKTAYAADSQRLLPRRFAFRIEDVVDGLETTIAVGEDTHFPDGEWINGNNLFDQSPFPINHAPAIENDLQSDHRGGVMVLMSSGNVRFLDESIDPTILAALCTRSGGEQVRGF
jgi:hypothetical protein